MAVPSADVILLAFQEKERVMLFRMIKELMVISSFPLAKPIHAGKGCLWDTMPKLCIKRVLHLMILFKAFPCCRSIQEQDWRAGLAQTCRVDGNRVQRTMWAGLPKASCVVTTLHVGLTSIQCDGSRHCMLPSCQMSAPSLAISTSPSQTACKLVLTSLQYLHGMNVQGHYGHII